MYLPSTTPSQRAFNAKRDIARGNIEGKPMAIGKLAGDELAALRAQKEGLTRQLGALRADIEAESKELSRLKVEAFDLKAKVDRYKIALRDFVGEQGPTMDAIKKTVAKAYGISIEELKSKRRLMSEVTPRHIAMYLCKSMTSFSFPQIGKSFGGRDHTTVVHAVRKIERQMFHDPELAEKLKRLSSLITECAE